MKTRSTYKPGPLKSRLRITQRGWALIVISACIVLAVIGLILLANTPMDPSVDLGR